MADQVLDARAIAEEKVADYPPFEFYDMDGELHSLVNPMTLETAEINSLMQAAEDGDEDQMKAFMAKYAPEAETAMDAMPLFVSVAIMEAWYDVIREAVADDEGKEPSPPSPRNRAERRSKQTSRSGAKTSGRSRSAKSKAASGSS